MKSAEVMDVEDASMGRVCLKGREARTKEGGEARKEGERKTVGDDRRRMLQKIRKGRRKQEVRFQTKIERGGCAVDIVGWLERKKAVEKRMKCWLGRREIVKKRKK
jgi:hypothetical protein